jgi:hyperosmotically inducible protein
MKTSCKQPSNRLAALAYVSLAISLLIACEQKGPAEKAGQKIDNAVEQAGEKLDTATEKAGDKVDAAKQSVKHKADVAEEYIDDTMITLKVKTALSSDPLLKTAKIEVTTVNGVVTLKGSVDSEASLVQAIADVNKQAHVKSVQSQLVVNPKQDK